MLPKTDPTGTRPLTSVEAVTPVRPAADPRREVFDRLNQISLGKNYSAEVMSRLNDGSFLIKLDNAALRVALPHDARVGDKLALKLVATEPRPTFLILEQLTASTTSLSAAARMIDSALHASNRGDGSEPIAGKAAILPAPTASASEMAAALRSTLTLSGLFYESHLHQWIKGGRSLADVLREPQARFTSSAGSLAVAAASGLNADKNPLVPLIDIVGEWNEGALSSTLNSSPMPGTTESPAAHMIGLQLNALENQRILWHGELWEGLRLEWEVGQENAQTKDDEDGEAAWTSVLRLELPTLGVVKARIRLQGEHVQMQLDAGSEQAASSLRLHGSELASALDAAGSKLDSFAVRQDGPA